MCLAFGRILFPFAIFMIALPSILGVRKSFFQTLLEGSFFNFISRISYSTYLIHGLVILYIANIKGYDSYYWISDLFVISMATIALSFFFGTLVCVIF